MGKEELHWTSKIQFGCIALIIPLWLIVLFFISQGPKWEAFGLSDAISLLLMMSAPVGLFTLVTLPWRPSAH
jgi:hypothetical protein